MGIYLKVEIPIDVSRVSFFNGSFSFNFKFYTVKPSGLIQAVQLAVLRVWSMLCSRAFTELLCFDSVCA